MIGLFSSQALSDFLKFFWDLFKSHISGDSGTAFFFCRFKNEIFTCPISKEDSACPRDGIFNGIGEAGEKADGGKIGDQKVQYVKNDPVHDRGTAADEKIHDLLFIFGQVKKLQNGVDDAVAKAHEDAAVIFMFGGFQDFISFLFQRFADLRGSADKPFRILPW